MKNILAISLIVVCLIGMIGVAGCTPNTISESRTMIIETNVELSRLSDAELQSRIDYCYKSASRINEGGFEYQVYGYYASMITVYQNELILRKLNKIEAAK